MQATFRVLRWPSLLLSGPGPQTRAWYAYTGLVRSYQLTVRTVSLTDVPTDHPDLDSHPTDHPHLDSHPADHPDLDSPSLKLSSKLIPGWNLNLHLNFRYIYT